MPPSVQKYFLDNLSNIISDHSSIYSARIQSPNFSISHMIQKLTHQLTKISENTLFSY